MNIILRKLVRAYVSHELPGWGWVYNRFVGDWRHDAHWTGQPPQIVRGKLHGYEMELNLSDWSDRATYFLGRHYDLETHLLLMQVLRPGDRFVDVGANIGMITLLASRLVGPGGIVDAIEPNPHCAERIRWLIDRNQITNIKIHNLALSNSNGQLTLSVPRQHSVEGTLTKVAKGDFGVADVETFDVPVRIGDELLGSDPRPPVLIKIDVEGFEHHVLTGLSGLLAKHKPVVITEVVATHLIRAGHTPGDLFALMEALGYVGHAPRLRRRGLGHVLQLEPADKNIPPNDVVWIPIEGTAKERLSRSSIVS